jgi:hypothetical protein
LNNSKQKKKKKSFQNATSTLRYVRFPQLTYFFIFLYNAFYDYLIFIFFYSNRKKMTARKNEPTALACFTGQRTRRRGHIMFLKKTKMASNPDIRSDKACLRRPAFYGGR